MRKNKSGINTRRDQHLHKQKFTELYIEGGKLFSEGLRIVDLPHIMTSPYQEQQFHVIHHE